MSDYSLVYQAHDALEDTKGLKALVEVSKPSQEALEAHFTHLSEMEMVLNTRRNTRERTLPSAPK